MLAPFAAGRESVRQKRQTDHHLSVGLALLTRSVIEPKPEPQTNREIS
jgi:hypothetical protein